MSNEFDKNDNNNDNKEVENDENKDCVVIDVDEKNETNKNNEKSENNENKDNKKNKEKKSKEKTNELEELAKEVDKLIDEVSSEYGLDPEKLKVMPIQLPKMTFKTVAITSLAVFLLDFLVMLALNGFFNWCEWGRHSDLVFFALYFAGIDMVLKLASLPLFPKKPGSIVYVSFLKVVPFILSMVICGIWPIFVNVTSYWIYSLVGLIIYSIRKFLITYYLEKQINKMLGKISVKRNSRRKKS